MPAPIQGYVNLGRLNRMFWTLPGIAAGALMASLPAPAAAVPTANLTIRVENLLPAGGILRLGLYDRAHYPDDDSKPVASADVKASGSEVVITLRGIAPGTYAIETFQDVNADGKMDMTWLGFPEEPFGFSRDARPHLQRPSFGQVAFTLVPGENMQVIHLQNSISLLP
jgi:uncharacterized protein (DUF2141 family)